MIINRRWTILLCALLSMTGIQAQSLSEQVALTAIHKWPDSSLMQNGKPAKWAYDHGVVMEGMEAVWNKTADVTYFNYIQKYCDFYVAEDGSILTYKQDDFNIDNVKKRQVPITSLQSNRQGQIP